MSLGPNTHLHTQIFVPIHGKRTRPHYFNLYPTKVDSGFSGFGLYAIGGIQLAGIVQCELGQVIILACSNQYISREAEAIVASQKCCWWSGGKVTYAL